jgi:translation initiation factor 4E
MTEVGVQPVEPHPTQEYSNDSEGCQSVLDAQYSNPSTVNDRITGEILGPFPSPNSTNKEVRGHPFEPHPQNAAAAYPHMIHHAPYTMRWQYFGPIPTTGSYGYYNVPFGPQTSYYPTSPHMMWPPVTSPPVHQPPQYYHTSPPNSAHPDFSTSTDAQDSLQEINETPPTSLNEDRRASVVEAEAQSSEEEQELRERGQLEGDEGEGEGKAGDGAVESDSISDVCEVTPVSSPTCHPLEATWVMWYDKITGTTRNHRSDYRSSLKHLYTISSVEDFWRLYNNIRQPSHLDRNSNYHFFKEGIDPMWEDPANAEGGKWVLTVKDDEGVLDNAWEELLLAMIGGLIQSCHAINGAVVSRRKKGDRVALWTRKKSVKVNLDICADLLKVLVIACDISRDDLSDFVHQLSDGRDGLTLVYMYHTDSLKSGTSYQNSAHIHLRDNCEALIAMVMKKLTGC